MTKICPFLLILISFYSGISQEIWYKAYYNGIMNEELDYNDYELVNNPEKESFQGEYGFGSSESEYEIVILYTKGTFYAKETRHPITENGFGLVTERIPIIFADGSITIHEKMTYDLYICIRNSINNKQGDFGIGYFSINRQENGNEIHSISYHDKTEINIPGEYPEASFVKLEKEELQMHSTRDLRLIRNEIFARNGHIFIENGHMDTYFSKQSWYKKIKKITLNDLNDIEKHNIKLIRSLE